MKRFIKDYCPQCGGIDGMAPGNWGFCCSCRTRWQAQTRSSYRPTFASTQQLEEIGFASFANMTSLVKMIRLRGELEGDGAQ